MGKIPLDTFVGHGGVKRNCVRGCRCRKTGREGSECVVTGLTRERAL